MKKSDFYYELPEEAIAQVPLARRDSSKLLYVPATGPYQDLIFRELRQVLRPHDCLVFNDSRVLPARLLGTKEGLQQPVEFLLLKELELGQWEVLVRPGRRLKPGAKVSFLPGELAAEVLEILPGGNRRVRFLSEGVFSELLAQAGQMPLPPYIQTKLEDQERYQTVYAQEEGSAAAPTAGLHFTEELLAELKEDYELAFVTLHVGLGTFRPVKEANILDHEMHSEAYVLPEEACAKINAARRHGGRIIAIGTTACRVLESAKLSSDKTLEPAVGETNIFIYPGYKFQVVDCLVTNFHLPESTLLMLVAAMLGRERILEAYEYALAHKYRFFSFGDAMFVEVRPENKLKASFK